MRDQIKDLELQPESSIVSKIGDKNFPLANNLFLGHDPSHLASQEFRRCHGVFDRRLSDKIESRKLHMGSEGYFEIMNRYFDIKSRISFKESYHIETLETLAEDTIREVYGVPESIELEGYINPDEKGSGFNSSNQGKPRNSNIDEDRMSLIYREAQKRVILNSLAHGSSVHIWKSSFYLVKDILDKMDPELMELYDEYTSIVSIMMWMYSPDDMERAIITNSAINQGHNKVTWSDDDEDGFEQEFDEEMEEEYKQYLEEQKENGTYEEDEVLPVGTSVAINFPVLLHEINKSVFEILSLKSIPTDFNEEELAAYYSIADEYTDEVWHYYLGPTLWVNMLSIMKEVNMNLADIYDLFASLSYEQLAEFCTFVVEDKDKAVSRIQIMSDIFNDE